MECNIILTYHRVLESLPKGLYDPAMFVTASTLDMHISEIKRRFNIVSIDKMIENYRDGKKLCVISFDDGWRDNYNNAFPVLKKHGVPATIFIPTNIINQNINFWFQDIWHIASLAQEQKLDKKFIKIFVDVVPSWMPQALGAQEICALIQEIKRLPVEMVEDLIFRLQTSIGIEASAREDTMNLAEIREMGRHGITFGSHGLSHRILTRIRSEVKEREVIDSFRILKSLDIPMTDVFCYPNGDWDSEVISYLKMAGYKGAVTTSLGCNGYKTDPFRLNRIGIHEDIADSASLLWFRLFQAIGAGAS